MILPLRILNKVLIYTLRVIFPRYQEYIIRIYFNKIRRALKPSRNNAYLFILSPPYCGSTLLVEILSTSKNISINNHRGTKEGQTLPSLRNLMFKNKKRWDANCDFNWSFIKEEWNKYWDVTKPVLLEKSPPNLVRASSIEKAFSNSYFIILFRNPYAHCESLMRRNNFSAASAARFSISCLEYQKKNLENLSNAVLLSYEELTGKPDESISKVQKLVPALGNIRTDLKFSSHNYTNKKLYIENLNNNKISMLTNSQIHEMNQEFSEKKELLDYFQYDLLTIDNNSI